MITSVLISLLHLLYDVRITDRNFFCGVSNVAFAFCIKDGFKFDCQDFSANVPYSKIGQGVLKLNLESPENLIHFRFKDGETEFSKSVSVNFYCFEELKIKKRDVSKIDGETFDFTFLLQEEVYPKQISIETIYGEVVTAQFIRETNSISVIYKRKFKYPYEDLLILRIIEDNKTLLAFADTKVSSRLILSSKTEPYVKIQASTKYSKYLTESDSKGNFKIEVDISPGEKSVKLLLEDRVGNRLTDTIQIDYPHHKIEFLDSLSFEDKSIFFVYGKTIPQIYGIAKLSEHIFVFTPEKPGEYSFNIGEKEFRFVKKNFPAFLEVNHTNQSAIYADGTSEISFHVRVSDVYGEELKALVELSYDYPKDKITISKDKNSFVVSVKKKVKDELNLIFSYEFLKYQVKFNLLPGKLAKIVVEGERDYVYGDGKDKSKIYVSVQDSAGNIVPQDIQVTYDFGEIRKNRNHDGSYEIIYSAKSSKNLDSEITFKSADLSKSISIRVLARKSFLEMSPSVGIINNLGNVIAPSLYIGLSYARLLYGRYLFFESGIGYLHVKLSRIGLNSFFFPLGLSYELYNFRIGIGSSLSLYFMNASVEGESITEYTYQIIPHLKMEYIFNVKELGKISPQIIIFLPSSQTLGEDFIVVRNSFERVMFSLKYIIEF